MYVSINTYYTKYCNVSLKRGNLNVIANNDE